MLLTLVRLLHILSAFWFISGVVARSLAYPRATAESGLGATLALLDTSERCDRFLVIPGSTAVGLFGLLTAWLQGQPVLGFVQGGRENWLLLSLVLYIIAGILAFGVLAPRRRGRLAATAAAREQGRFTPELRAALEDPVVRRARRVELALVAAIVILMVVKPF